MQEFIENIFIFLSKNVIIGILVMLLLFFVLSWIHDIIKHYKFNLISFFMPYKKVDFGIIIKRLNYIKNHDIKSVNIRCEKRKMIFIDFINFRINNFIKMVEDTANKTMLKMDGEELYLYFKEKIYLCLEKADRDIISNNIPPVILEKYKLVEDDEVKILERFLRQVCFSKRVYGNNYERLFIILDFICVIVKMSVVNAESVIDELNGQLDGILYKGIGCSNCNRTDCEKYHKQIGD